MENTVIARLSGGGAREFKLHNRYWRRQRAISRRYTKETAKRLYTCRSFDNSGNNWCCRGNDNSICCK